VKPIAHDDSFWGIVRYKTTGVLDPTFSGDGKLIEQITSFGDLASDVGLQPTGEIVVGGTADVDGNDPDAQFAVVRLMSDGSPDFTFSDDAVHEENPTSRPDFGNALALQEDGKIVIAGTSMSINSCCMSRAIVVRLTAGGDPDDTFSGSTIVTDSADAQGANDMLIQPIDGRIVTAGRAGVASSTFALVRLLGS
jgi:uncharacterized delta-60 repeat protein